jgi:type IV pilus assembly protein PilX
MTHIKMKRMQSGAALITSLIFLTVLTILGMSTLGTALLESRMAGNARDKNLAFQAAEVALRDAEQYIANSGRVAGPQDVGLIDEGYEETAGAACAPNCAAQKCEHGICYKVPGMQDPCSGAGGGTVSDQSNTGLWNKAIQYYRANTVGKGVGLAGPALGVNVAYISPPDGIPLVRRQPEYLIESFPKGCDVSASVFYYRINVRAYGMRNGTLVKLQEVYHGE